MSDYNEEFADSTSHTSVDGPCEEEARGNEGEIDAKVRSEAECDAKARTEAGENEARSKVPACDRNPIIGLGLGSDGVFMRPKGQKDKPTTSCETPRRSPSGPPSPSEINDTKATGNNDDGRKNTQQSPRTPYSPRDTDSSRDNAENPSGDDSAKWHNKAIENEARCKVPARERNPITGIGLGTDGVFMRLKGQRAPRVSNPVTGEGYMVTRNSLSLHPKNPPSESNPENRNNPGGNSPRRQ